MQKKFSLRLRNALILSAVAIAAVSVPSALISAGAIDLYIAQVLTLAAINAVMAISVNLICGVTGQLSLGQAGFMAIGAYSCAIFGEFLPMPLAMIAGMLVSALFGFFIGFPTLKLTGDYLAIVTLGFGEIIRVVLVNLKPLTGGATGKQMVTILSADATLAFAVISGALVAVIVLLSNFLNSTFGRAILAVREDEIAADSNGINVFRYKMIAFIVASSIAGLGGALYAPFIGFIKPDLASYNRSIDYLIFVVLGGMGSLTGSVMAALALTFLQEILRFLADFRLVIYPVILILVMLFRPQGLLGTREISFVGLFEKIRCAAKAKRFSKVGVDKTVK